MPDIESLSSIKRITSIANISADLYGIFIVNVLIKDLSVTAKFKLKDEEEDTFVLAWTTTPWTLPGNVALAVGEDVDYVKLKVEEELQSFEKKVEKKSLNN